MGNVSIRTRYLAIFLVMSLLAVSSQMSLAGSLQDQEVALNMIADFAERFCEDISLEGYDKNLEVSGNAKAELNGIINKLVNMGIEGAAKYQDQKYSGVLQKDLVNALQVGTECRLVLWNDLKDRLLPKNVHTSDRDTHGLTIAGTYWMDGMSHRVITVRHKTGNQFSVAEYTSPWKWEGNAVVDRGEISGEVRFLSNDHPLWIEGLIQGNGNIKVVYVFLDEKNKRPTGRRDEHVWVKQ